MSGRAEYRWFVYHEGSRWRVTIRWSDGALGHTERLFKSFEKAMRFALTRSGEIS